MFVTKRLGSVCLGLGLAAQTYRLRVNQDGKHILSKPQITLVKQGCRRPVEAGQAPRSSRLLPSPPQPAQTLRRARGSAGARGPGTLWQSLHPHPALLPESRGIQISGSGGYFIRFLRAPRLQGQPLPLRSTPALSAWGRGVQSPHPCSSAWHSSGQRGLLHPGRAQDQ